MYRVGLPRTVFAFLIPALVFAAVVIFAAPTLITRAQDTESYVPKPGQQGKDVIWLPTASPTVDAMLDIAKVTPTDTVIDLGSGDGRTVIEAAKRGARAVGIEFNPKLVEYARKRAAAAGVADRTEFIAGDIFKTNFSHASVLTMFLLPDINLKLRPQILDMKPGTRIVTNTFTMGDWKPDNSAEIGQGCTTYCTANLWYVPAKLAGRWESEDGTLHLDQNFQMLAGALANGSDRQKLTRGKVTGTNFSFQVGSVTYDGQIEGDKLVATKKPAGGAPVPWTATRTSGLLP